MKMIKSKLSDIADDERDGQTQYLAIVPCGGCLVDALLPCPSRRTFIVCVYIGAFVALTAIKFSSFFPIQSSRPTNLTAVMKDEI